MRQETSWQEQLTIAWWRWQCPSHTARSMPDWYSKPQTFPDIFKSKEQLYSLIRSNTNSIHAIDLASSADRRQVLIISSGCCSRPVLTCQSDSTVNVD
ncbi:hypothetical protein [Aquitalea pelogenes]|uniref:hypothetical protein n=1 Tax=Aquitalea pelogenes TaxID=1293573 RepID=UPI00137B6926|nr:hypothetical protein [Aquitalea pelogenes]